MSGPPSARAPSGTRGVAAAILARVAAGAYANVLLGRAPEMRALPPSDRALVGDIVLGAQRNRRRLDAWLRWAARRELDTLEAGLVAHLRAGAVQFWPLRLAAHAVVAETVEAAKRENPAWAGITNAILRRLSQEELSGLPPGTPARLAREAAFELPSDIAGLLAAAHGPAWLEAFAAASRQPAPLFVRCAEAPGPDAVAHPLVPWSWQVRELAALPAVAAGRALVQDPASTAVGFAMPIAGTLVDMCAAPGTKTTHLAERQAGGGCIFAFDVRAGRARLVAHAAAASPFGRRIRVAALDGRHAPRLRWGELDAVLVDAPCTGLGTLRRRPELRDRVDAAAVARLAVLQGELLDAAAATPAAAVVYAVCTVTEAETRGVVDAFLSRSGWMAEDPGIPGAPYGAGVLLNPHEHSADGMFVALLRRPGHR